MVEMPQEGIRDFLFLGFERLFGHVGNWILN
jgi:hypothetical protein